jgi:aquaporin Z
MRKYIVEFIGTFFLVATIGFTVLKPNDAGAMAPLAIGAALMVMVFAGGHISGAHYNPAVTLAVFLRGKCSIVDLLPYWIAQFGGAAAAACIAAFMKGTVPMWLKEPTELPLPLTGGDVRLVVIAEFLYTLALCWVVLHVATAQGTSGNSFYGLAIGFTVLAGAYSVGSISGGAFNPAVAGALIVWGLTALKNYWIFLAAELAAAIVAAILFRLVNRDATIPPPAAK